MELEYSWGDIDVAAKKLKDNKAVGHNEVNVELIEYGCNEQDNQTKPGSA